MLAQLSGIGAAFLFASVSAAALILFIQTVFGIRTSVADEGEGKTDLSVNIGPLRISVRRSRFAWSGFEPVEEFVSKHKNRWTEFGERLNLLKNANDLEYQQLKTELQEKWQFIRKDDTRATLDEVSLASNPTPIFVNYRYNDARFQAIEIYRKLTDIYGGRVYCDADGHMQIHGGQNVWQKLENDILVHCKVFIAVIGDRWKKELDARLTATGIDFVRREIAWAIRQNVVIIPVFVGEAKRSYEFSDPPADLTPISEPRSILITDPFLPKDPGWDELFRSIEPTVLRPVPYKRKSPLRRFLEVALGYPWKGLAKDSWDALIYPKELM